MVKRVLPCPVCSGSSYIESFTQGGLICSDCGTVSNQIEVADDEDPQTGTKTFVRSTSYRHVTEAESQAKRDRRVVLKVKDKRCAVTIFQGIGFILEHMTKVLVDRGLCPALTKVTVRETWFEFLQVLSKHVRAPVLISKKFSRRLETCLAKWGIPVAEGQRRAVLSGLPPERSKQHRAMVRMLEARRIDHAEIRGVWDEAPGLLFAHDWLCLFFGVESPLSDGVLVQFGSGPLSWGELMAFEPSLEETLTPAERRRMVKELFRRITESDSVRKAYFRTNGIPTNPSDLSDSEKSFPVIDVRLCLPLLVVAIRNAGGGVLPTHLLNWIARGELPFYSAHKCLPRSVDRVEYYRITRSNHGFRASIFCPQSVYSAKKISSLIFQFAHLGLASNEDDPMALLRTALDMLGLSPLFPLSARLLKPTLIDSMRGAIIFQPDKPSFDKRMLRLPKFNPLVGTSQKIAQAFVGDSSLAELVALVIAVSMKLVFPALHKKIDEVQELQLPSLAGEVADVLRAGPVSYTVQATRERGMRDIEWWDSLTGNEKGAVLNFCETEMLNEVRDSLVDDIRTLLEGGSVFSSTKDELILVAGPVNSYQRADPVVDPTSALGYVLRDICAVTEARHPVRDLERLNSRIGQFEQYLCLELPS